MGKPQRPVLRRDADGEMVIDNRKRVEVVFDDLKALSAEVVLLHAIAEAARGIGSFVCREQRFGCATYSCCPECAMTRALAAYDEHNRSKE